MNSQRRIAQRVFRIGVPIATLIVSFSDVIAAHHAADRWQSDIWISESRSGRKGEGTRHDPFDGSTEAKLDAILAASKPGQTIHFGPGTFLKKGIINGGAQVKAGQRWAGAGPALTILKLSSMWHPPGAFIDYAVGNGSDQDAADGAVERMTIDCNARLFLTILGTNAVKADAIQLHGAHNLAVRDVRIIHNHGDAPSGNESFPLSLGGFTVKNRDTWCKNAVIDRVTIESYASNHTHGGAITLYLVDGGVIRNCIVRENRNGSSAYGFLGANCTLINSQAIDCGAFFYAELNNGDPSQIVANGGWRNFTIKNCQAWIGSGFRDNNRGNFGGWFCLIANGNANDPRGLDGLDVENNKIVFNRGAANCENGSTVHTYRAAGVPMKNFVVRNNLVRRDPRSVSNPGGSYFRHSLNAEGVVYENNVFKDGWHFMQVDRW